MPYADPIARREYQREYKQKTKEKRRAAVLDYERGRYAKRRDDPEFMQKRREKNARYRDRHRSELAAAQNARQQRNLAADPAGVRERQRANSRKFRASHTVTAAERARSRASARNFYQERKDDPGFKSANVARATAWYRLNPDKAKSNSKRSRRKRVSEDINVKLGIALRRRLWSALRGRGCKGSAVRDLGCSIAFLREHLERNFLPGMTWNNWGVKGWHIDHIRPLKWFDLTKPGELSAACHWTNLQPLWAAQNIGKGARPGKPGPDRWAANWYAACMAAHGEKK